MIRSVHLIVFFMAWILIPVQAFSQRERRDTSGTGSVDIISNFKPTLRDLVKFQFSAQPPAPDSLRQPLSYRIPSQELSISYQPGVLKPLAFLPDSNTGFRPAQYVKLGYGSLRNPYASVALEWGKKNPLRFYGGHQSASGARPFQKHSISSGLLRWQLPDREMGEWSADLNFIREGYNKYGYDTSRAIPPVDSLRQVFHDFGLRVAYRRKKTSTVGFVVEPVLEGKLTGDRFDNRDVQARLWVPIRYHFNDRISMQVDAMAHWGRISRSEGPALNRSVYSINPAIRFEQSRWSVHAGIRPAWDSAGVRIYPDVNLQWSHASKPWFIRLNWSGELLRTGYRDLYSQNPWLWMPAQWRNQGVVDRSVQWQYQRRAHWVYDVKVGYATQTNTFLFVNDTSASGDGKSFQVVYADRIQNLYARAAVSYRQADRWLISGEAGWNQYHSVRGADKAWGLLPFEWKLSAMHRFANKLRVQADLYSWFAPLYLTKSGASSRTDGAFDLNLGGQMPITPKISAWLQFNNLLNQTYSRWSQYPVYGFHFVGGVVFSLDKSIP